MVDLESYSPRESAQNALTYLNSHIVEGFDTTELRKRALRMIIGDDELDDALMRLLLGMTSIALLLVQLREMEGGKTPQQTMEFLGAFLPLTPEK